MPGPAVKTAGVLLASLVLIGGLAFGVRAAIKTEQVRTTAISITGGDPDRGQALVKRYGCAGCHTIPGVRGANGLVGPPLQKFGSRVYIAGVVTNTPDNLIRWLKDPPGLDPKTAMPATGVSDADARDIAAYLYTLN